MLSSNLRAARWRGPRLTRWAAAGCPFGLPDERLRVGDYFPLPQGWELYNMPRSERLGRPEPLD
jgi:hypothetical protein